MKVLRWIYDWITVLTASLVGLPSILLQLLNSFDMVDLSPLLPPEYALRIVTGVAIAKAILAFIESQLKKEDE